MSEQGPSSNDPVLKRKRGRPRNFEIVVEGEYVPTLAMPGPDNVLNSNQTTGVGDEYSDDYSDDDSDDEMLGKAVAGVIDGTFDGGYLINVQVENTHEFLRGVVFLPEQVAPVTVDNDVAAQLPETSEPGHVSQSASNMCDQCKNVKQSKRCRFDTARQLKLLDRVEDIIMAAFKKLEEEEVTSS